MLAVKHTPKCNIRRLLFNPVIPRTIIQSKNNMSNMDKPNHWFKNLK